MSRTAVVLLYVVPLLLTAAYLVSVGLVVPAVALLVVEAGVVSAVLLAKRPARPQAPRTPGTPRDGAVVVVLLGLLVAAVVGALVAVRVTRGG